jgi:serine/threonine protein kinase
LESFSTESEAFTWTQKLSHDNIVKYLGTYQFGDKTFGFLFPLAATDLKTHMSSPRPKSISAVVHILEQLLGLANALHYLHTGFVNEDRSYRNILHMDIKPSNILVFKDRADSDKYTLQLADFGLSRVNERAQSVSTQITVLTEHASQGQDSKPRAKANDRLFRFLSTQTSKVQGSTQSAKVQGDRAYTAPEVELKNQKSSASDIWSFGCVLLECITWLCAGSEALERFKETIAREDTENSLGLWVQDGSAEVTLKPTVKRLVDILSESADHEPSLEPLASLFRPGGVLDLMPERRMDAAGIEVQLRSFLDHKDLEKGIDSLMNGLPSSEAWARLFSTTNTPNLESDQPRLEPQVTAGPIAEDRTPDRLESIPEKVQASLKTRTTAPAAVQEPPPEAQGIATEEQSLRGSRESFERHNGRHNLLRSDAGEKCRSAWNSITQRDKALLLPQQNSAPSQVSNRSCPPQSTPRLDARRISKLPRRMTPEDVRNAVTRLKSQNTSPQTVKMRSGGAVSLRSAETRLNPLMDAY